MKGKQIKALLLLLVALLLTSCGSSKPDTKNGARPVVIGLGKGDGDSIPYVDTDAPPATPTPTPTPTPSPTPTPTPVPTGEVSPSVTPEALGTFSAEDCVIIVAGVEIRTGMDYTGKENLPGEIIDKLEGVACLEAGNDINYYYKDFHVDTVTKDGKQIVYSADFTGGGAVTSKKIGIGSTEEELLSTYGEPYSHTLTGMIYQDGVRHLTFYLAKGKVTEMVLSDSSFH